MDWRSRKGLGIIAGFLFLMGVVVPAVFGLLTEKAMELGMEEFLDKSTNWDNTNIANSTYFVNEYGLWGDTATASKYEVEFVYDESSDMDLVMFDTSGNPVNSYDESSDYAHIDFWFNKASFVNNVDKVVVLFRIEDKGNLNLDNAQVEVILRDNKWGDEYSWIKVFNATDAYNNTLRVEFTVDAVKLLKIRSSDKLPAIFVFIRPKRGQTINLDGVVVASRVELYDMKKVNATSAANIMLTASGILGWIGALAATPYWNPASDRSHRDVRRVYRGVRGRIRRR